VETRMGFCSRRPPLVTSSAETSLLGTRPVRLRGLLVRLLGSTSETMGLPALGVGTLSSKTCASPTPAPDRLLVLAYGDHFAEPSTGK
jgi:hypothetical protein